MRRTTTARIAARWLTGTLAFVAAFWLFDLLALRAGTPDPLDDSWEYGVVARALLHGHGFRTMVIHPPLWSLRDAALHVPVLVHGPLVPLALLPAVLTGGARALDGMAFLAALFAILAAAATFRAGERLHSAPVGTAAAALLTLSPLAIRAVHHDVALLAGAWLLAESFATLVSDRPRGAWAGVALGLGALARPEFLLAYPLLLVLARGARAVFTLGFLLCVGPWMMHTALATGSPVFNLSSYLLVGYWGARPGIGVMRDFSIPPSEWPATLAHAFGGLPAKWIEFFPHAAKRALASPSGATGWLAPIGWLLSLAPVNRRRLGIVALVLGAIPLAVMTVTLYDARYLVPFLPLACVGAAIGARELTEWGPWWVRQPRAWMGMLLLLVLPSTGPSLNDAWREAGALRARLASERAALHALPLPPEGGAPRLVYSDTPDFVAWTLNTPAVWMSEAEYRALPAWDGLPPGPLDSSDRPLRTPRDVVWFHEREGLGRARAAAAAMPADSVEADTTAAVSDSAATSP